MGYFTVVMILTLSNIVLQSMPSFTLFAVMVSSISTKLTGVKNYVV